MRVVHRGKVLSQAELDLIVPIMDRIFAGEQISRKRFETLVDEAINADQKNSGDQPEGSRSR